MSEPDDTTCQFCAVEQATLIFPPREQALGVHFTIRESGQAAVEVGDDAEPWRSCPGCAPYVRRLDARGLAHRAARLLSASNPAMGEDGRAQAKRMLQGRYGSVLPLLAGAQPLTPA